MCYTRVKLTMGHMFYYMAKHNGMDNAQIANRWIEIYPAVYSFNRATSSGAKDSALGISRRGGSVVFTKGDRIVGSRWGSSGRGIGEAYCTKGCS